MSEIKNGGPAFPADPEWLEPGTIEGSKRIAHGMTLRDYFAAKAMEGLIASYAGMHTDPLSELTIEKSASACYAMADAMLRAREH